MEVATIFSELCHNNITSVLGELVTPPTSTAGLRNLCMHIQLQIYFASCTSHICKSVILRCSFRALLKIAVAFHTFIRADFFLDSSYEDVLAQGKDAMLLVKKLDVHRSLCCRLDPQKF